MVRFVAQCDNELCCIFHYTIFIPASRRDVKLRAYYARVIYLWTIKIMCHVKNHYGNNPNLLFLAARLPTGNSNLIVILLIRSLGVLSFTGQIKRKK